METLPSAACCVKHPPLAGLPFTQGAMIEYGLMSVRSALASARAAAQAVLCGGAKDPLHAALAAVKRLSPIMACACMKG